MAPRTNQKSSTSVPPRSVDPLLSPAKAAEALDSTVGTLANWCSTKRYPLVYVKIGRSVKYRLSDIRAFIESRSCGEEL